MSRSVFFVVSKTMNWLVYPLSLLLMALLVVTVAYRRRWARGLLATVLLGYYVLSMPITAHAIMRYFEVPRPSDGALRDRYDAIIVLSGLVDLELSRPGRVEFGTGVDRMLEGMALVRRGVGEWLIISGGSGLLFDQSVSEAELLRAFAVNWGIPSDRMLIDGSSRNTHENAVNTAVLMRAHGLRHVLLVTSSFHMRRALATFHKQGVFPDAYPVDFRGSDVVTPMSFVPDVDSLHMVTAVVNELVGLVVYRVQGYI